MILLHTAWRQRGMAVWAEAPRSGTSCERRTASKRSPYDAGSRQLLELLRRLLWSAETLTPEPLELHLPTWHNPDTGKSLPLQPLFKPPQPGQLENRATLRPWIVTACILDWRQAFTLLSICQQRRLAPGVFAGEELIAAAQLFRYAGSLVARGRYLPTLLKPEDGDHTSRWHPLLDREEHTRLEALAEAFPLIFTHGRATLPLVAALLAEMVDRLVRLSVATTLSRAHAERGRYFSAHDAWFAALRGDSRKVRWESVAELNELEEALRQWRRPLEGSERRDTPLVFHLATPESASEPWFLSIRISGAHGLEPFPADLNLIAGKTMEAEESALWEWRLRALGQAVALFAPLAQATGHNGEFGCTLSAEEAHAFMSFSAPILLNAGYGVVLPDWWQTDAAQGLVLTVDVAVQGAGLDGDPGALQQKVGLEWSAMLDEQPVTQEELETLLAAGSPLVFFRGRWIHVDVRQLQEALRTIKRRELAEQPALEVVRLALGCGATPGLEVARVGGDGWLSTFIRRLGGEQSFELLPPPEGFCGELRPYQLRGFSWLAFLRQWGFGACLADDMGLGKTIQTLAFLLREKAHGQELPTLLVAPMSILGNWQRELRRFAPGLRAMLHHGAKRHHGSSFAREAARVDVVLTSFQLLHRDYSTLRGARWGGIIIDEAQNIKNPDTHQSQAARALQADYRIALTGTPIENHVGDLWAIMDFLNPGLLGRRATFREHYFQPIQSGADPGARARLRRVTSPFLLRRLKTDRQIIDDLPDKTESKVVCALTREQAQLYGEVLASFQRELAESEGIKRRGLILAVLTRLKQVCNHPAHYLTEPAPLARRSGKLKRLEEMLEEIFERGESALIFTQYAAMGELLQRHLQETFGCWTPFMHGAVPRQERDRLVREFQESAAPTAFVLSLKVGGIGLNLTRATHVFHYDRWWNPAVEDQATDRAYRIGQTRDVMVHKFICGGTLEERIDEMIEQKSALASEIVGGGEAFLTELSDTELDAILKLSETIIDDERA